ncbi:hypothetical protein [Streptomyces sp. NBC_01198]|uniref:hypothetical protein n=1 Tax=Streptomyces sp. NBC_01198 TaxID=2903769 RepID=UPI002E16794F|nr:hypothetical protein OG702_09125 [Streptomyces sp. NBC_01198]
MFGDKRKAGDQLGGPPKRAKTERAASSDDLLSGTPATDVPSGAVSDADDSSSEEQDVVLVDVLPAALHAPVKEYVDQQATRLVTRLRAESDDDVRILTRQAAYALFPRVETAVGVKAPGDPSKLAAAAVKTGLSEIVKSPAFKRPGNGQAGAWYEDGHLVGPASKAATRDLQLLNHLSQALINHVGTSEKSGTKEIEAMAINGRILISANEQRTVTTLLGYDLATVLTRPGKEVKDPWAQRKAVKLSSLVKALGLTTSPSELPGDSAEAAGVKRLVQLQVDCTMAPAQAEAVRAILATLHKVMTQPAAKKIIDGGTPANATPRPPHVIALITGAASDGRFIAVNGQPNKGLTAHAEQNLLHAAILASHRGRSSVAGGKRPCTVCWVTLRLAREYGYDVSFNPRPGGLWDTTTYQGLQRVAQSLGIMAVCEEAQGLINGTDLEPGLVQHATAASLDAPPLTSTKLRETVIKSTVSHRNTLTQSASESLDSQSSQSAVEDADADAGALEDDDQDLFLEITPEENPMETD